MESAISLLVVVGFVISFAVLVVVSFIRSGRIKYVEGRLASVETQLSAVEKALGSLMQQAAINQAPPEARAPVLAVPVPLAQPPTPTAATTPAHSAPREPILAAIPVPAAARRSLVPPPVASRPLARSTPAIEWERWLGVRGAAVLGGAVFILAGILFFKYSIDHDLIPPAVRVAFGVGTGLACILISEKLKRRYEMTSNPLAGAGTAILYAAFWAARVRYQLIGIELAFGLMALTTAASCLLSIRRGSLVLAVLGLVGGFATPFLLASAADNPVGLFGYLLLLDVGFLWISYRRRWVGLAVLSLAGTVLLQAMWIGLRMDAARFWLGIAVLGLFALVFAVGARPGESDKKEDRWLWLCAQGGAILAPFGFALYFASRADWGPHFYPTGSLILLLSLAAGWVGRQQRAAWLGIGAASANLAVFATWIVSNRLTEDLAWETNVSAVVLAAVFHGFAEWERHSAQPSSASAPAKISSFGFSGLLLLCALFSHAFVSPWPWMAGAVALCALLLRLGTSPGQFSSYVAAASVLAVFVGAINSSKQHTLGFPVSEFLAALVGLGLAFQAAAFLPPNLASLRTSREKAAAVFPLIVLLSFLSSSARQGLPVELFFAVTGALAILVVLAATRLSDGRILFAGMIALAAIDSVQTFGLGFSSPSALRLAFAAQLLTVLGFTGWVFLARRQFREDRWAWYAAALSGPCWFLALKKTFEDQFGADPIGLLAVVLGAISLGGLTGARVLWPADHPQRKSALVWFSAVAGAFVTVAIPLQLEKHWITVGWALEGLACLALWKRLDHPGLKYFALCLLGAVGIRLVLNPSVLAYYPRGGWRILNWSFYTYGLSAAAMLGGAALLAPRESARLRAWEKSLYPDQRALGTGGLVLNAILVVFVWINLAIADWFGTGPQLAISWERMPAKDLSTSIAWVLYALILLAAGMKRASGALRWVSLLFLVLTIGKVFLYDLGELKDLYRVISLLGLALSLIAVSLAYQRFVFRKEPSVAARLT